MSLKFFELTTGSDEFACFVRCVSKLMEVDYLSIKLDPADKKDAEVIDRLKMRTPLGRFPVLQLSDGQTCISESLSIAKFLANNKHGFYGPDEVERAQIDQWMDVISAQVSPLAKTVINQVLGLQESDVRVFSQQSNQLR